MEARAAQLIGFLGSLFDRSEVSWVVLGFVAQSAFFLRFFIQWIVSEKEKRSVIPTQFWYASLVGGMLLLAYSIHRRDPVFILGQAAGALIYMRNLVFIHNDSRRSRKPVAVIVVTGAPLVVLAMLLPGVPEVAKVTANGMWLVFGFVGQAIFLMRFVVQWIASERHRKSVMPMAFWHLSLVGGVMLFSYAVRMHDPVFILGQGTGLFIYSRNIVLIRRSQDEQ